MLLSFWLLLPVALLAPAAAGEPPAQPVAPAVPAARAALPTLGLFSTLPLYWPETEDLSDLLNPDSQPHWALPLLQDRYRLVPLDLLEQDRLGGIDHLLLAQPRILAPAENVVLDGWVRRGGTVLLFADPQLTGHSRFGVGDPRRPQDVVLLSPILRHWGLELFHAEDGPAHRLVVLAGDVALPVMQGGRLELRQPGTPDDQACTLALDGLLARCRIGQGQVVILADAALLEEQDEPEGLDAALAALLDLSFGR